MGALSRKSVWSRLLAGVHVLDAVALVLEGGAVCAREVGPAALFAFVLLRRDASGRTLAKLNVANGPDPCVIRDHEGNIVGRDAPTVRRECRPGLATHRPAGVEDEASGVVNVDVDADS